MTVGYKNTAALFVVALIPGLMTTHLQAEQSPYLYGIHDYGTGETEWLNRLTDNGVTGWVTATVAIGHNPNDYSSVSFNSVSNLGHTVICRLNNGYGWTGTIPEPTEYSNFATRCANFVANSTGCDMFIIGNETNLASEWPMVNGWRNYISPQSYASCFRMCYDAIKAVRPDAKVIPQALAPFAGPYGPGADHDGNPLGWTDYMNEMLTAIDNSGGLDGIAVHINSRGYTYVDVHSTNKVNGQYFSFYVYKDWVNLGTPAHLRTLPYYATECNGIYYWDGGHPECTDPNNPSCSYQEDWLEWIYAEIDAWNQDHFASGEGIYHCVNMYRWCSNCDGWNIDGSASKTQMLQDLGDAAAQEYRWQITMTDTPPTGTNLAPLAVDLQADSELSAEWAAEKATDGIVSAQSKWVSTNTAPPHWLALDLGSAGGERTVNGYTVRLAGAAGESTLFNATSLTIESGSSITGPWTEEVSIDNSQALNVINRSYVTPKQLRYIRLVINDPGTDNYARIPEFEVVGEQPPQPGDFDLDGDVDQADFGFLQACFTGSFAAPEGACVDADLNSDALVDGQDLTIFRNCISGPDIPASLDCVP